MKAIAASSATAPRVAPRAARKGPGRLPAVVVAFAAAVLPGLGVWLYLGAADGLAGQGASVPGVEVRGPVIDLGPLGPRQVTTATFRLTNRGPGTVPVKDVAAACGCTTVRVPTRTAAGGEQLTINVDLNASIVGESPFRKEVRVGLLVDGRAYELPLYIAGSVDASQLFTVFPSSVDFGQAAPGEDMRRTVYFRGGDALVAGLPDVFRLDGGGPHTLSYECPSASSEVLTKPVHLVFRAGGAGAGGRGPLSLTVKATDPGGAAKRLTIPMRVEVVPPVTASPPRVYLTSRGGGPAAPTIDVTLRSRLDRPLVIRRVHTALPLEWEVLHHAAANHLTLRLGLKAAARVGRVESGTLEVEAEVPSVRISVPVSIVPVRDAGAAGRLAPGAVVPGGTPAVPAR